MYLRPWYYSDFHVWTFAYDVSGISSVVFNYRKDMDGINPLQDNSNEVYKSGQSHGIYWRSKDCVCSAHHVLVLQCLFLEKVRYWLRLGQLISDTTIPVDYTTKKPTTHCWTCTVVFTMLRICYLICWGRPPHLARPGPGGICG